jgi:hypothetical protein
MRLPVRLRLLEGLKVLDLGPRARVIFAATWLAGQSALIVSATWRPDNALSFRMFPEASTMQIHLVREVGGSAVEAPGGEWSARDATGQLRHFAWKDRVRDPVLSRIDARVFASYGADTQLARLQRALDDVLDHTGEDAETERLRADVEVSRNGGPPSIVTLVSHARPGR